MKERLVRMGALAGMVWIARNAFSIDIRRIIGRRDRWTCQDPGCNRSFHDGWMVHASHYDHSRNNPRYNTPDMGRIQCIEHHLQFHEQYVGRAKLIGLTEGQNKNAINALLSQDDHTHEWILNNRQPRLFK